MQDRGALKIRGSRTDVGGCGCGGSRVDMIEGLSHARMAVRGGKTKRDGPIWGSKVIIVQ